VRSELGAGSTFFFSLPRTEKPQLPVVLFGAPHEAAGGVDAATNAIDEIDAIQESDDDDGTGV
jgi:hypothetical protein